MIAFKRKNILIEIIHSYSRCLHSVWSVFRYFEVTVQTSVSVKADIHLTKNMTAAMYLFGLIIALM